MVTNILSKSNIVVKTCKFLWGTNVTDEKFPVSETLKIIDGTTIYKTDKWWSAVVVVESFGRRQINLYLWNKKGDDWKRRQKFLVPNKKEQWTNLKEAVEKYMQ